MMNPPLSRLYYSAARRSGTLLARRSVKIRNFSSRYGSSNDEAGFQGASAALKVILEGYRGGGGEEIFMSRIH